ncbi:MAG TPA: hypothetical protein VIX85_14935 [Acidimicrobiales bacterium]
MATGSDSKKVAGDEVTAVPTAARPFRASEITLRIACHVGAAATFVAALVAVLAHGWLPTGDDAIIAQRAWGVFTAHPPLVGQFSQASGSVHAIYDPGPLLFWLLALPVRVDPVHGVLWGATLLCLVGVALAVEAAWAFRRATAAGVVVIAYAVVAATQAFVVVDPAWNISIGLVWFTTTAVLTVTVASGRLGWWPVLVGAASIAAQAHLEFAPAAVGLVLLGLGLGLARRPRPSRWGWLVGGLVVGAICWAAPLVDELTRRPGNFTVLWHWLGSGATQGGTFGFQALGAAVAPRPLWSAQQNRGTNVDAYLGLLGHIGDHSELFGVIILASLALIASTAWLLRRRHLAVVASVALFVSAMAVWVFASLPQTSSLTIVYSDIILWPVGMLVWVAWLWAAAELGAALLRAGARVVRQGATSPAPSAEWEADGVVGAGAVPEGTAPENTAQEGALPEVAPPGGAVPVDGPVSGRGTPSAGRLGTAWRLALALGVLLVGAAGATLAVSTVRDPHLGVLGGWSSVDLVPAAASAVDRARPEGPIAVYADGSDSDVDYSVAYGVIWQLRQQGRDVTASYPHWQPLGPAAAPSPLEPHVTIHVLPDHTVSASVTAS